MRDLTLGVSSQHQEVGVKSKSLAFVLIVCLSWFATTVVAIAQKQSSSTSVPASTPLPSSRSQVFLFVQRSDNHVKRSRSEVFYDVLEDLRDYLKSKNVVLANSGRSYDYAEGETPQETILNLARDAKATSVLYVIVDRPCRSGSRSRCSAWT